MTGRPWRRSQDRGDMVKLAILREFARRSSTGAIMRCHDNHPHRQTKIIYNTLERAQGADAAFQAAERGVQYPYPCPVAADGHFHLSSEERP